MHVRLATAALITACSLPWAASASETVLLLRDFPACMSSRLGPVSAQGGTREPDMHGGMRPPSVNYNRVFNDLREHTADKGGNAVVLRNHRADYVEIGAGRRNRPSYVHLQGTAIVLPDDTASCTLATLDIDAFVERARQRQREAVADNPQSI